MDFNSENLTGIKKTAIKNKKLLIMIALTVSVVIAGVALYNAQSALLKKIEGRKKQETIKLTHLGDINKIVLSTRELSKKFYGISATSEDIMNQIAQYIKTHNATIVSIEPSEVKKGGILFYNFDIKLKTDFINLLSFLYDIEEADKIFIIKKLGIQQASFTNAKNTQTIYPDKEGLSVSLIIETCALEEAY